MDSLGASFVSARGDVYNQEEPRESITSMVIVRLSSMLSRLSSLFPCVIYFSISVTGVAEIFVCVFLAL